MFKTPFTVCYRFASFLIPLWIIGCEPPFTSRKETGDSSVENTVSNKDDAGIDSPDSGTDPCITPDLDGIRLEANYIHACQYLPSDKTDGAYGAINDYYGSPTWVVPGELSIAGMGLLRASEVLNDSSYRDAASYAADYLVRIQDKTFGGWHDQYDHTTIVNQAMSLRNTAQALIFINKLGIQSSRMAAMINGAGFIQTCQGMKNKGGIDDGLVSGGRDANLNFQTFRWLSDNAYAYQALQAAARWADQDGDESNAQGFRVSALQILNGITTYFLDASKTHWKRVIDQNDVTVISESATADWISYAPVLLDLPLGDISPTAVGDWTHQTLQQTNGAVVQDNQTNKNNQSPGYSFQASLAWSKTGQCAYIQSAMNWAIKSSLWQKTTDMNGITGGWIDWTNTVTATSAKQYERFVDTSAYAIMNWSGGYSFTP